MADKHPYIGGTGSLVQVLDQLQKSFPTTLNADWLKKLGFAPKNESYIVNIVRFLGLIDDEDARTDQAQKAFTVHDPDAFKVGFASIVKAAYSDLFDLHGEDAWTLGDDKLVTFFRQTDQSSDIVGKRQAATFRALSAYTGHGELQAPARPRPAKRVEKGASARPARAVAGIAPNPEEKEPIQLTGNGKNVGLTVRIEINLPSTGDQETYDKIFKSIRENLLNG